MEEGEEQEQGSDRGEDDSLILLNSSSSSLWSSSFSNFMKFSLTFSISHATVDGILIYTTSQLGQSLGSTSGSILYFLYSLSSLLYARLCLKWLGCKYSLLIGMFSMLTYVTTFFIAVIIPAIKWYVCIPGAIIGGIGAGILWPAQGGYYSENAYQYSTQHQLPIQEAQNQLAGYFAGLYLGMEGLSKLFVTLLFIAIPNGEWKFVSFLVYAIISLISTLLCTTIQNYSTEKIHLFISLKKLYFDLFSCSSYDLMSIFNLLHHHPIFFALLPYQASFGLCSAYMVYVIDGVILPEHNKEGYIGGLGALSILTAALFTLPITILTSSSTSSPSPSPSPLPSKSSLPLNSGMSFILFFGPLLFAICSSVVLYLSPSQIASWSIIIPLVLCYGIGRGIWENTNKSVIATLFHKSS